MSYCPACGHKTIEAIPAGDDTLRQVCPLCGHVHYENPKILVACIVYEGDKVLWIKRAHEPYTGRWAVPAGFMERGETVLGAACREFREETGLTLLHDKVKLYSVLSLPDIDQVYITYFAPLPSHDFHVTAETLDIRLLSQSEIAGYDIAYPPQMDSLISQLYRELQAGGINAKVPHSAELRSGGQPDQV